MIQIEYSIDAVGKIKYNLKAKKIWFTEGRGEVIWKQAEEVRDHTNVDEGI